MATVALASPGGRWIMASAILASSMAFIDSTALNVVLPSLQRSLQATGSDLFWILNAYLLMLASLILIGGSLGDKLGRKRIFMLGLITFIVGSAACGFAPGVGYLIGFRAFQGLGGALMIPGSLSLISSSIDDREKGKAIGTWSAITTVVTMGGPVLGGALADAGLWRYIFFINIPLGILAILILWGKVKETREDNPDPVVDYPGVITIAMGLACLTYGCLMVPSRGINNSLVYTSLGAGILLLLTFILLESRSKHAMMPLHLFANRTFSGANLLTFFLYAGLGAGMLFLSLNLVQAQGYSQLQSGLTFLPFTVLMISLARLCGRLSDQIGPRLFLILGPGVASLGLFVLSLVGQTRGPADYWTTFFPGVLLLGLGMSITVAPLTTTVMSSVSDEFSGTASGINNAMTRISGVFANAVFGALAVLLFSGALAGILSGYHLDPDLKRAALAQSAALGDARTPVGITLNESALIKTAFRSGFIVAYGHIMRMAAGLGFLGALMGAIFVRNRQRSQPWRGS
jgi:EmrB/QacA subfamily drug resistance transporter